MTDTFSTPRASSRKAPPLVEVSMPQVLAAPAAEPPRARRARAKPRGPEADGPPAAPATAASTAPHVAPRPDSPPDSQPGPGIEAPVIPADFVTDAEHPVLPIPFAVQMGEARLAGVGLSVSAAYVAISGPLEPSWQGHREVARLQFEFSGFSVTLPVEVAVSGSRREGEMTLQFLDPLGPHLPQLRHVINSFIAGDLVSMGGLLSYAGPTKPKVVKTADPVSMKFRLRGLGTAALSVALIAAASYALLARATQATEPRPVFVERTGQDMRATTAGQLVYLNPEAKAGEVVFSINANSGDVLNFQLPCDCEIAVTEGVFEGATVLPIDVILSIFDSSLGVRVQTQMSVEGLARVVDGDRAFLDINDGRSIPVRVMLTSATNAAAQRGDLLIPVSLIPEEDALGPDDVGKAGRLRLTRSWLPGSWLSSSEDP